VPGDLRDPEQTFPFYYDSRYEQEQRSMPEVSDLSRYVQSVCFDILGHKLDEDTFKRLMADLDAKGILHRIMGDPSFREAIADFLNKSVMARKIARYVIRSE